MANATNPDQSDLKLEALLKAARRATWDALHGPRHLRSGRFRPGDLLRTRELGRTTGQDVASEERSIDTSSPPHDSR